MLVENIKMLRFASCRLSQRQAADYLGYSLRHYKRIEAGHSTAPRAVRLALESYAGILHHPHWRAFHLYGDEIRTPDGYLIPSGALRAWHFLQLQYAANNPRRFDAGYFTPNAARSLSLD